MTPGTGGIRLCFDVGPGCGLGHRRRMEALAAALRLRGERPELLPLDGPVAADVLVVDSYQRRADDAADFIARRVAAVDDLGRDLAVDLLVDPIGAGQPDGRAGSVLTGLRYALVDPALAAFDPPRPVDTPVRSVLVTTGGTDVKGLGARMAGLVADAVPAARVRLVTGPWGSRGVPPGVEGVDGTAGIDKALAGADIVVTAGGVTMLEAMRLGRPVVAVMTADNQRHYLQRASDDGAIVWAGLDDAATAVASLADDPDRRVELSARARGLVDGQGADRVSEKLLALA